MSSAEYTVIYENDKLCDLPNLYKFLIAYQHKSIILRSLPEAPCLTTMGLYDILDQFEFQQVTIHTANPLENHPKHKIKISNTWHYLEKAKTQYDLELHTWNQHKVFLCMYGRASANRLGFLSYMNKHYDNISCLGCRSGVDSEDQRVRFELTKLFAYRAESLLDFASLENKLPMILNNSKTYSNIFMEDTDHVLPFYKDILIDIVSETFMQGVSFFPTEKTTRPIMHKKPMIVMASRDYLDYLHQLGFRTFCDFWSEEYDGYEGKERFLRILDLIDFIAKKSQTELQQIYQAMQPILNHNFELLRDQTYNKQITKIL